MRRENMKIGKSLKKVRERKEYSQENIANIIHVSKQLVSHLENDRRSMTEDLAKQSVSVLSDAQYGFEVARETAEGYIAPLIMSGEAIEWHRLALQHVFINQVTETIERFEKFSLVQPPEFVGDKELEGVRERAKELLDIQMIVDSFLTCLEQEYNISVQECMDSRLQTWKKKGWIN